MRRGLRVLAGDVLADWGRPGGLELEVGHTVPPHRPPRIFDLEGKMVVVILDDLADLAHPQRRVCFAGEVQTRR